MKLLVMLYFLQQTAFASTIGVDYNSMNLVGVSDGGSSEARFIVWFLKTVTTLACLYLAYMYFCRVTTQRRDQWLSVIGFLICSSASVLAAAF